MKEKDNVWMMVGRYSGFAILLPVSAFVGYAIGYVLDMPFHTSFLRIVFLLLGIASGFIQLIRELNKDTKQ